jgi:predicted LPLAT superfamily acyltransferase
VVTEPEEEPPIKAIIKEIRSDCGLLVWVAMIGDKEICRSLSEQGLRMMILHKIRKNRNGNST